MPYPRDTARHTRWQSSQEGFWSPATTIPPTQNDWLAGGKFPPFALGFLILPAATACGWEAVLLEEPVPKSSRFGRYVVLQYDKTETMTDPLDDEISVRMIRELIDWATADPLIRQCADTQVPVRAT